MRLCFYNPQAVNIGFAETLLSALARIFGTDKSKLRKHNLKYEFLFDILKNNRYSTAIVVDGTGTSLHTVLDRIPIMRSNYRIYKMVASLEVYIWCLLNGLNPFKANIIFNKNKLDERSDILFGFAFCSYSFFDDQLVERSIFKSFTGKKILHASHFYKSTKLVSNNVKKTGTKHMAAEADLKKSPYFNKFFDFIDQVYVLPHALRKKYVKTKKFSDRKNKCLALGTLVIESEADDSNRDYLNFFKINTLHPMRKAIYENRENLSDFIDCYINFHSKKRIAITERSNLYKKYNIFRILYDLLFLSEGKDYHSMDIVAKYNEYKMFIAPEENIGLSSINVVEGMACGCAYIGLDHPMYRDLGMIDRRHFISYDGTLKDLKGKIRYYQNHENELREIAENGYTFAKKNFSEKKVTTDFWQYLEDLAKNK